MAKNNQTTPVLAKIIRDGFQEFMANVHTSQPGKIVSFDPATGLAEVEPQLKRKYFDEDSSRAMPVISKVPVVFPGTDKAFIKFPLKAGDFVMLAFSERSIDRWRNKGKAVDPEFDQRFALSDAIAFPGLRPKTKPLQVNGADDSVEIANGSAYIEITDDGKFKITSGGTEVLDEISKLADALDNAMAVATGNPGPIPMDATTKAAASGVKSAIDGIKA